MKRISTAALAVSGMLAALVTVTTMSTRIPVLATEGYIHLGDALILLSAMLVGPLAIPIGGIGSALADLFAGYGPYVLPTLCIKALVGFVASRGMRLTGRRALIRCAVAFAVAELLMVLGYFVVETVMISFAAALVAVPMNLVQAFASVAVGCALLPVAKRLAPRLRGSRPL